MAKPAYTKSGFARYKAATVMITQFFNCPNKKQGEAIRT